MRNYSSIKHLGDYYLNKVEFICCDCKKEFTTLLPLDECIVKFSEVDGEEVRWLPTYGKNGYLELMAKLLEGRKLNDAIDMKTFNDFQEKLRRFIKPSSKGNSFVVADLKRRCPICNSKSVKEIHSEFIRNPNIEWIEIDDELLNV